MAHSFAIVECNKNTCVNPQPQGISCASGCSKGLVCCWELVSGKCLHEFEEYRTPVLKLSTLGSYLVALFADESLRVWESGSGSLLHTIKLVCLVLILCRTQLTTPHDMFLSLRAGSVVISPS